MIALFVMGEMCNAQILFSGQNLNSPVLSKEFVSGSKAPAVSKSVSIDEEAATNYLIVSSTYDFFGVFSPDGHNYSGYPIKIEMPDNGESGEVIITGIYDFGKYDEVTLEPIKGIYDSEAATVTIPTPFDSKFKNKCVKAGTYERGEEIFTGVLAACKIGDTPDMTGQYPINILDELVFDIAQDGTLTPRSSWLIYSFGGPQNGIENIFNYTVGKVIADEATLIAVPEEIIFPEDKVYAGTKATQGLNIVNIGRKLVECDYDIRGGGLSLGARMAVDGLSFNAFEVYLTAENEGDFNGSISVIYNGNSLRVPVKADVQKAIDFNSIVKNGLFSFSLPESDGVQYNPWVITDEITGWPVALAALEEDGTCGLNIDMEVPEGEIGVFSWKGIANTQMPNGFMVVLDETEILYSNLYLWEAYTAPHPADGYVIVPEGAHTIRFEYIQMMDWYKMGLADTPQSAYVWDLALQTYPQVEEFGVLADATVDFGTWYVDKFVDGAYREASILNLGTKKLRVIGGENSSSFEVAGIGREVNSLETLMALISFHGEAEGDYDETVTIKTNGGDFKVRCLAKAEKIINDYSFLVSEGSLSFGTSVNHPFDVDTAKGIAYSSTAKLENYNDPDPDSWLSVSFVIPEGQTGTLSWEALNSSNDYFQFGGAETFTDGTQIIIDGDQVAEFVGICNASSLDIDDYYLTFEPGRHFVKFNYVRKSTSSNGNDDRFVLSSIGLEISQSGVEDISADKFVISEMYYTLDGYRVLEPVKGVFIKKSILSDGDVITSKIIK